MSTIIIGSILAAIVLAVIINMRAEKKQGKSSCGSGCSDCPMSGKCHSEK